MFWIIYLFIGIIVNLFSVYLTYNKITTGSLFGCILLSGFFPLVILTWVLIMISELSFWDKTIYKKR